MGWRIFLSSHQVIFTYESLDHSTIQYRIMIIETEDWRQSHLLPQRDISFRCRLDKHTSLPSPPFRAAYGARPQEGPCQEPQHIN